MDQESINVKIFRKTLTKSAVIVLYISSRKYGEDQITSKCFDPFARCRPKTYQKVLLALSFADLLLFARKRKQQRLPV